MRSLTQLLVSISILFVFQTSYAGGSTGVYTISRVYIHGNWSMATLAGAPDNLTENPSQCDSNVYYALDPSQANYEVLHSTLLAAHLSGRSVQFFVHGCGGQFGHYPAIHSIWIH